MRVQGYRRRKPPGVHVTGRRKPLRVHVTGGGSRGGCMAPGVARGQDRRFTLGGVRVPCQTPMSRICRLLVGVNGIAYCPEKHAWHKDLPSPTPDSIPSSDR